MIEVSLYFTRPSTRAIIDAILAAPGPLKPTRFSVDEEGAGTAIRPETMSLLLSFAAEGFFLKSDAVLYDVKKYIRGLQVCNSFMSCSPENSIAFLGQLQATAPFFGFACVPDERDHRNRIEVSVGEGTLEAWVGRDPRKALPGLYWCTLLSNELIDQHGIPLKRLQSEAIEHIAFESCQMLRFYDDPFDWMQNQARLDHLCATIPGIFDVQPVRSGLPPNASYPEMSEYLAPWS